MRVIFSKTEIQNAKNTPNFFQKIQKSPKMREKFIPLPWQPIRPPHFQLGSQCFTIALVTISAIDVALA